MDFKKVLASTLVASMVSVPCSAASDILSTAKTAMSAVATVVGGESAVAHTIACFKKNVTGVSTEDFGINYGLISCPEGIINFDNDLETKSEAKPKLNRTVSLTVSGLMTLGGVLGFIA